MRVKEEKVKINLRFGMRIRELLEDEAAVEDIRIGTLTNRLLQEELEKVLTAGADHCIVIDSKEYRAAETDIQANRKSYYLFPTMKTIDRFIETQLDDKHYPQISLYFTPAQVDVMKELVQKQRIPTTIRSGEVKSYRYVVAGMLLNHPLCSELGASVN